MVGRALWLEKCPSNFHEDDGRYCVAFHQLFCGGVFGRHYHIQQELSQTLATHSTCSAHSATTQAICKFGKKKAFGMNRLQYLGFIVDKHGVHVDPTKIQVIRGWPTPTTLTELRSFLIISNFYCRFVLGFSHIAWALSQVGRGSGKEKCMWGHTQQKMFDDLRQH
jgi:hypothetical protein